MDITAPVPFLGRCPLAFVNTDQLCVLKMPFAMMEAYWSTLYDHRVYIFFSARNNRNASQLTGEEGKSIYRSLRIIGDSMNLCSVLSGKVWTYRS